MNAPFSPTPDALTAVRARNYATNQGTALPPPGMPSLRQQRTLARALASIVDTTESALGTVMLIPGVKNVEITTADQLYIGCQVTDRPSVVDAVRESGIPLGKAELDLIADLEDHRGLIPDGAYARVLRIGDELEIDYTIEGSGGPAWKRLGTFRAGGTTLRVTELCPASETHQVADPVEAGELTQSEIQAVHALAKAVAGLRKNFDAVHVGLCEDRVEIDLYRPAFAEDPQAALVISAPDFICRTNGEVRDAE